MDKQELFIQIMALLMGINPKAKVGKLLNFCVATHVASEPTQKTPLDLARELMNHPENLATWLQEVVESDGHYTIEEMLAILDIPKDETEAFMEQVMAEIQMLDTQGL
ncbi:MAG: hypothetical protein AAGG51_22750 [Cyanobacteria bacterium P01_G01_bin.54]